MTILDEINQLITEFLPFKDLLSFALVSKESYQLIMGNSFWNRYLHKDHQVDDADQPYLALKRFKNRPETRIKYRYMGQAGQQYLNQCIAATLQAPNLTMLQHRHLSSQLVRKQLSEEKITITQAIERCPKSADDLHPNQIAGIMAGLTLTQSESLPSFTTKQMQLLGSETILQGVINDKLSIEEAIEFCAQDWINKLSNSALVKIVEHITTDKLTLTEINAFCNHESISKLNRFVLEQILLYIFTGKLSKEEAIELSTQDWINKLDFFVLPGVFELIDTDKLTLQEVTEFCSHVNINKINQYTLQKILEHISSGKLSREKAIEFCNHERIDKLNNIVVNAILERITTRKLTLQKAMETCAHDWINKLNVPQLNAVLDKLFTYEEVKGLDYYGIKGLKLSLSNDQARDANVLLIKKMEEGFSFEEAKQLARQQDSKPASNMGVAGHFNFFHNNGQDFSSDDSSDDDFFYDSSDDDFDDNSEFDFAPRRP